MEDISFTVVPVGETGLVGAHLNDRCGLFFGLAVLGLRAKTLLALVGGAVSGCQVHAVRVDYLSFLLQVKGVLVVLNLGIINLSVVVLPVVGVENLGVGVLDETVSASRVAHTFVPNGKLLDCQDNDKIRIMIDNGISTTTDVSSFKNRMYLQGPVYFQIPSLGS